MSDEAPEYDYIDYASISFPSDRLTIADMRRAHPDLFDVESAEFSEALEVLTDEDGPSIGSMLHLERMLAQNAYEEVFGLYTPSNFVAPAEKPGFVEELTQYYMKYHLATGPHHALEMISAFEAQAASQARGEKNAGQGRS